MLYQLHKQRGITLIELLLYITIASGFILSVTLFLFMLLEARVKNALILEINGQGNHVMHVVADTVRGASSIGSPAPGASDTSLSVTNNGTIYLFDLVSDTVRITEGINPPIDLTNTHVTASGLTFSNLTRTDTPGTIQIEFTLEGSSSSQRQEFSYTKSFRSSATLRDN